MSRQERRTQFAVCARRWFSVGLAATSVSYATSVTSSIYGSAPKACVRPWLDHLVYLSFLLPSMVSVIMVMYITGRNEFKCFAGLFELWFPICGSTCCLCVLSHVVAYDKRNPQPTGGRETNASRVSRRQQCRQFLFFSFYFGFNGSHRTVFSHFVMQQTVCVFLMWNN